MLYNPLLDTFICVAKAGSFNKAAEELFISAPAVIKQVNLLENQLGIRLFSRSHRGLELTNGGRSLYKDARYMMQYSRDALERAKQAQQEKGHILRLGTSPITPPQFLLDIWPKVYEQNEHLKVQLVPFENTPENAVAILNNLGRHIDIVSGFFDEGLKEFYNQCRFVTLCREPLCCAVSRNHRLAGRERLQVEDLYGETLFLLNRHSTTIDGLRDYLRTRHKEIQVVDFPFYDIKIFNRCEAEQAVLLTIAPWKTVHPLLKILPVEWDYSISYGFWYSRTPSDIVREFLDAVQKALGLDITNS